ncbi:hypothetical protein MRX96_015774 [Rhipicephalus microplus]
MSPTAGSHHTAPTIIAWPVAQMGLFFVYDEEDDSGWRVSLKEHAKWSVEACGTFPNKSGMEEWGARVGVDDRFHLRQVSEQLFVTEAASFKAALERILNCPYDSLLETSSPRDSFGDELPVDSVGTCVVSPGLA